MSGAIKQSTRLTGLAVSKNPHRELGMLYSKILSLLEQLPKDYAYRRYTEKIVQERSSILEQYNDVAVVEEKIGCGQIEEVIMQAKYEVQLAAKMRQWKPWEGLVQEAPPNQWTWPPK